MPIISETLQDRLDQLSDGDTLKLDPPAHEFKGPLLIRKPVVVDGQGGTIWTSIGPTLTIEAPGVVLRDVNLEITSRSAPTQGEKSCALVVSPGLPVILENVAVRGNVLEPGARGRSVARVRAACRWVLCRTA